MNPNQKLAEQYGTSDPEKNRQIVDLVSKEAGDLQWGMGLLGAGIALAMMQREGRRRLETELAHHQMAESERERVYPATSSLRHTRAPVIISSAMSNMVPVGMDEGMVRIAAAIGSDLAGFGVEDTLAKQAMPGIGAAAGGFKNMISGAAKGLANKVKTPASGAMGKVRQGFQEMGAHMTDVGNRAAGVKAPAGQSQLSQMRAQHANQNLMGSVGTATPPAMKAPGLQPSVAPKPSGSAAPEVINPAKGVNGAAPAAAPAGAAGAAKPGMLQRTGLFGGDGKLQTGKLLGAGALAGAGYLAYKGISKGIGFMNEHAAPANYNLGGAQIPMGVNQYGNPQY